MVRMFEKGMPMILVSGYLQLLFIPFSIIYIWADVCSPGRSNGIRENYSGIKLLNIWI